VVSSDTVTGSKADVSEDQQRFFERLRELRLSSKLIVGFGVSDKADFDAVTRDTHGAIIGSAFIRSIADISLGSDVQHSDPVDLEERIVDFVRQYR
jgi:tryptophan synthase alpha chain